jgi:hypothetical protein
MIENHEKFVLFLYEKLRLDISSNVFGDIYAKNIELFYIYLKSILDGIFELSFRLKKLTIKEMIKLILKRLFKLLILPII